MSNVLFHTRKEKKKKKKSIKDSPKEETQALLFDFRCHNVQGSALRNQTLSLIWELYPFRSSWYLFQSMTPPYLEEPLTKGNTCDLSILAPT